MTNKTARTLALVMLFIFALAGTPARAAQHDQHAGHAKPKAKPAAKKRAAPRAKKRAAANYVCPMHPEVTSARPGKCPKCNMNLTAAKAEAKPAGGGQPTATPPVAPPTGGAAEASSDEAPKIPDVPVVDQDGKELKFYSDLVKDKTVAINFIFTTCTTVCPPLTATFRKVQQTLGERGGKDVHLISISVDPATDTPTRLKGFAEKFKAGPGWTFVTGGVPEINSLLRALGAGVADKNDHTPTVLVGNDRAGHWTRAYGLAPAASLVKVIDEAAAKGAAQAGAGASSAAAVPSGEKTAAAGEKSAAAAYFPNHVLLTQDNRPVRFYDDLLKGKIVLINFMFTTCAGVCSPMTANLAKVQAQLGDRVGKDVAMISISVDPAVDTPETLKKYAAKFKAGPGWHFLTGKKENVDWVLYKLGGYVEDKSKHTGVLIIGNEATGEWVKTAAMKSPAEITEAVTALLKADKN
jgi:protein SCO1